jgi:hypothetical protein
LLKLAPVPACIGSFPVIPNFKQQLAARHADDIHKHHRDGEKYQNRSYDTMIGLDILAWVRPGSPCTSVDKILHSAQHHDLERSNIEVNEMNLF